jgi:hypothetical protein
MVRTTMLCSNSDRSNGRAGCTHGFISSTRVQSGGRDLLTVVVMLTSCSQLLTMIAWISLDESSYERVVMTVMTVMTVMSWNFYFYRKSGAKLEKVA